MDFKERFRDYEKETKKERLDDLETVNKDFKIWNYNPSFKDINQNLSIFKAGMVVLLVFLILATTFMFTRNILLSIGVAIFTLVFMGIAFPKNVFGLGGLINRISQGLYEVKPFEDLDFFEFKGDDVEKNETLYFMNKRDATITGMRFFQIKIIAENITPNIKAFIKALSRKRIPFTYQIVQSPKIKTKIDTNQNSAIIKKKRFNTISTIKSYQTDIYFSVFYYLRGNLSLDRINSIEEKLDHYTGGIYSDFYANYHHYKLKTLSGEEMIGALKVLIFKDNSKYIEGNDSKESPIKMDLKALLKIAFIAYVTIYSFIIFPIINIAPILTFLFVVAFISLTIFLFWRDILYYFTFQKIQKYDNLKIIDPFKNIDFFQFRGTPNSIFMHINKEILVGVKISNLYHMKHPLYLVPDKSFRVIIIDKIPFSYNVMCSPMIFGRFYNEGFSNLTEKCKWSIQNIKSDSDGEDWMIMRGGIWKTILNMSTSGYKFAKRIGNKDIDEIEKELSTNSRILIESFESYFPNCKLIKLEKNKLLSGFKSICIKNKFFRINGTHLNYLLVQGITLKTMFKIPLDIQKGVKTRAPSEFNSPLDLKNFITIGYTINTENWSKEIPSGFKYKQIKNLLITNGAEKHRRLIIQKIIAELIKTATPSIVFDFDGEMSKLIKYFKDSIYEDDILYFKLGSAFNVEFLLSEIPADKNNLDYLSYVFDAYGLALKKSGREIELLKNMILKNPELDLKSFNLEMQNQQSWEKSPIAESVMSIFTELTQQTISFMGTNPSEKKISVKTFIENEKTVIIDLSILKQKKMKIFAMFIIVSKIIHFINNLEGFKKKILYLPDIEMFFDDKYLSREVAYKKIDKFFKPLFDNGFGVICSSNHIRYLHSNVLNFLNNIISLNATHTVDVGILKSILNLQEIYGKGIFGPNRKTTYQIDYLKRMGSDKVIIKRSDLDHPYPNKISTRRIKQTSSLEYDEILTHMERQGYDIRLTEAKLIQQAESTTLEKDLGKYSDFFEEIMKFLGKIKKIDEAGDIYLPDLKEALSRFIGKKAKRIYKKASKVNKVKDEILTILIRQGYFIEEHQKKTVGGSESIRTSYSVSSKFFNVFTDYFRTKKHIDAEIPDEVLSLEENIKTIFEGNSDSDLVDNREFRENLKSSISQLIYSLLSIYDHLREGEFAKVIEMSKDNFVRRFLVNLCLKEEENEFSDRSLEKSINFLIEDKQISYTKEELSKLIEKTENIEMDGNINEKAHNLYEMLSDFSIKMQSLIEQNGNLNKEGVKEGAEL